MKQLLILLSVILGVIVLKRKFDAVYDFMWEVRHDRYYLLWMILPRWAKRAWCGDIQQSTGGDDDLMSLDDLYREFGVGSEGDELES